MNEDRFYALNLLWIHNPDGFKEYEKMAKPVLARHGVHIERWIVTKEMMGTGLTKPDNIVVTWFRNASAIDAFVNDPEYKKAAEQRDKSANLVTITGRSVFGD